MIVNKCEIRVRYAETDQMQFVWHGNYLQYFEIGRTELLRGTGFSYKECEEKGFHLPLIESHLEYKTPGRYDEVLVIKTCIEKLPTAKMIIHYTITEKDSKRLVVKGYTTHCFMRKDSKVVRAPEFFINLMKPFFT